MPDFKQTFQEEVRRLARKELKALDEKINEQKKTISALQKRLNELEKKQAVATAAKPAVSEKVQSAPVAESRKVRFSPKSLMKFRKKYALSQKALAILLDVTPFTVSHWEIGKNRPRTVQIEAFNALTKLGKRKLLALVAEKAPGEIPAQKKTAKKKVAKKKAAAPAPAKRGRKKAAAKEAAAPVLSVNPASVQQNKTV
jgi:DNA-binding transcriptional regulator YiaG